MENERITKLDIVYTATNIKNELDSFTISQAFNKLQRYECLGTVDEFKALKEKNEPKEIDRYYCPICRHYFEDGEAHNYCPECGQALET